MRDRNDEPDDPNRWSPRGLELKLALALLIPIAAGALVAAFLPWPEWGLLAFGAGAFVAAAGTWGWLVSTTVRRLWSISRALQSGHSADLYALPADGNWGEFQGLADAVETYLDRQRELEKGLAERAALRAVVERLAGAAAVGAETESVPDWTAAAGDAVPAAARPLVESLALGAARQGEREKEARAVARLVRDTVSEAGERTTNTAAAAERQFVEATSLMTVLRELRRWNGELATALDGVGRVHDDAIAAQASRTRSIAAEASDALDNAIGGTAPPLDLARESAARLRGAADAVRALHEHARLAAIDTTIHALADAEQAAAGAEAGAGAGERRRLVEELTAFVARVQDAERRTAELAAHAADDLATCVDAAQALRERLEGVRSGWNAPPATAMTADTAPARRALDRVQEMVREALARGEKLVHLTEKTSSEAVRASDGSALAAEEMNGLLARLDAVPGVAPPAADTAPAEADPEEDDAPESRGGDGPLRVLGPDDVIADDGTWPRA